MAAWKENFVRVEGSKNRLAWMRPLHAWAKDAGSSMIWAQRWYRSSHSARDRSPKSIKCRKLICKSPFPFHIDFSHFIIAFPLVQLGIRRTFPRKRRDFCMVFAQLSKLMGGD